MELSPEANKVIDQLAEIIRGHYSRVKGQKVSNKVIREDAVRLVKERISD